MVIARLQNIGMGVDSITECTRFARSTVQQTLESPAYQEWSNANLRNAVSVIDAQLSQDTISLKQGIQELVPAVIRRLEKALQSQDESIALRACAEILDRDERFQKQQNTVLTHVLIPSAEIERARVLARELRAKQSSSTGEAKVLDVTPKQLETAPQESSTSVTT